ncbi:MAG: hypothetical protein HUU30_16085 [Burkholderiaceae bacterium]|nr:hypothetical protein [Aquabacterium sp.]NUP87255.1 hypothetical protein [Burkholderiaceae bacterium]
MIEPIATAYPEIVHTIAADAASGTEGQGTLTFTVTRSGNIGVPSTVNWFVGGTVDASDFGGKLPVGRVSFAAGEFVKTITVRPLDDHEVEDAETVTVTLGALTGNGSVHGVPRTASLSLQDNDIPPEVSIGAAQVLEGGPGEVRTLTFTLTRTGNIGGPTDVIWTFEPFSPTITPEDFAGGALPTEARVSFAPGASTLDVAIAIAGDATIEGDESFVVRITPVRFGLYGQTRGVGTILTDDTDHLYSIAATAVEVSEGHAGGQWLEFTVVREGNAATASSVQWAMGSGPADDDLAPGTPRSGTLEFGAGERTQTLRFEWSGDTRVEHDEQLVIELTATTGLGAGVGPSNHATTVVHDDDPRHAVRIAALTPTVAEGSDGSTQVLAFEASRDGELDLAAQIEWHLEGSADAADLAPGTPRTGMFVFAAGAATARLELTALGDRVHEPDESVLLVLAALGDLIAADAAGDRAQVLLRNDDEPDEFRIVAGPTAVLEGSVAGARTSMRFEIVRVGHTDGEAWAHYRVAGSGVNPADADDFGGAWPAGALRFLPGESRKVLYIPVSQDTRAEFDEGYTLLLSHAEGAGVSVDQGHWPATIASDELPPARIVNGADGVTERVSLPGPQHDYQMSATPDGGLQVQDTDPGRSGTTVLRGVELLAFGDGVQMRLQPDADQLRLVQIGQALKGAPGLDAALYTLGLQAVDPIGWVELTAQALDAFTAGLSSTDVVNLLMAHLGISADTLPGAQSAWQATHDLLAPMFAGNREARASSLLTVLDTYAGLTAHAEYGAAARGFAERVLQEWQAEFATLEVSLAGLPGPVVDLSPG